MPTRPLVRRHYHPDPGLAFLGELALVPARAHEFCGAARRTLALIVARATEGPVFWIRPAWNHDRLHGPGVTSLIDPGRLILVEPRRAEDMLWSMEEILRTGIAPLCICECPGLPGLTPVRRLHLAAETALREHRRKVLGLLLTPGQGGAQGVESRWALSPHHPLGAYVWRLERRRARMAPPKSWRLCQQGDRFDLADWVDETTPRERITAE